MVLRQERLEYLGNYELRSEDKSMEQQHKGSLTLLSFVPAGIHVGQSDVGTTQTLNSLYQLASLLLDHIDDHLCFFRALL